MIFLFVFSVNFIGIPNETLAQDKASKIDEVMNKLVENHQFNGSVLVAENGKVILKNGYGFANMDWEISNTVDTKFRIGSITKQFVAMQVMQLVQDGKVTLDGKLTDYIPEYRKDTGEKITIHHLLTHTSGIPSYTGLPSFWSDSTRNPYEIDYMIENFHSGDLEFEPGAEYRYNNTGYFLLAVIIERITGKSFEENLQERILKPLNMTNSGVDRNLEILDKRASGYMNILSGYVNEPYFYMVNALGAGDMYSTVEDLYLWDRALHDNKVLSEKNKNIMFTPFLNGYAYGWGVYYFKLAESTDSVKVISHSGGINGFNTRIHRLVDDNHVIILLNNTGSTNLGGMCATITNILYDKPYSLPKKSLERIIGETILANDVKNAIKKYRDLKTNQPDDYNFNEWALNRLGYQLLGIDRVEDAIEIFKLNIEEYPDAFNPYDSLGEGYMIAGEKELAIKNYKKSLELNPDNTNAVLMIEKMNQSR
jgi:CubicO group peptidase (beta-lactamase class C family)